MEIVRGKGRGARKKRKSESQKLTRDILFKKGKKMLRKERIFFCIIYKRFGGFFNVIFFFCLISQPLKVNERFFLM